MATDSGLLASLERYYDAVPRSRADVEDVGPFTLFVARAGWPYYARPRLGRSDFFEDDVRRVLDRQRTLGVPQTVEWVHETTPGLFAAAEAAGMSVQPCPLLVLDPDRLPDAPDTAVARMLRADDEEELRQSRAAISLGFRHPGTDTGEEGIAERDALMAVEFAEADVDLRERIVSGSFRAAAAWLAEAPTIGPVGGGGHSPVDDVTEVTGVAVLPRFRRRGLGALITTVLARDALESGVVTVFCSAESADVARVYEGVGFQRVGTACIAERQLLPEKTA